MLPVYPESCTAKNCCAIQKKFEEPIFEAAEKVGWKPVGVPHRVTQQVPAQQVSVLMKQPQPTPAWNREATNKWPKRSGRRAPKLISVHKERCSSLKLRRGRHLRTQTIISRARIWWSIEHCRDPISCIVRVAFYSARNYKVESTIKINRKFHIPPLFLLDTSASP